MTRFAILLVAFTPCLLAAPVPKAVKKKPTALDGTWEVVERLNNGKPITFNAREFWVFDADTYTMYDTAADETAIGDGSVKRCAGSYRRPDADGGTAIDLWEGRNKDAARLALDGDTLQLALPLKANWRPAEATPAADVAYLKFQRVDPAKLKAK
jgi:hypothetical protein